MPLIYIPAFLACAFGAGMGGYAMINPDWAQRIVRLATEPDKPEGRSEFRATYGGLFLFAHVFAAWALATQSQGALATAALGMGWLGSSIGRMLSFNLDRTGSQLNWMNVIIEATMALALVSPLAWPHG